MASAPAKTVTISNVAAGLILGTAVLFDGTKVILFFIDGVPLVGPPIAVIGSYTDSILEFLCVFTPLYFIGAYKGKNTLLTVILTGGAAIADLTPFINDLPSTTLAVTFIIVRSRVNDKAQDIENAAKGAANQKNQEEQQLKNQASQAAAQRAHAGRSQAMSASRAAAQAPTTNASRTAAYARRPLPDGRSNTARRTPRQASPQNSESQAA